jgi:transcription elongation factor Elf1
MGRSRRKVTRLQRKKLPNFFLCPQCGRDSIKVIIEDDKLPAVIFCGNCNLTHEITTKPGDMPVDIYCKFTDIFYSSPRPTT